MVKAATTHQSKSTMLKVKETCENYCMAACPSHEHKDPGRTPWKTRAGQSRHKRNSPHARNALQPTEAEKHVLSCLKQDSKQGMTLPNWQQPRLPALYMRTKGRFILIVQTLKPPKGGNGLVVLPNVGLLLFGITLHREMQSAVVVGDQNSVPF